jgi:LysM repeat protein
MLARSLSAALLVCALTPTTAAAAVHTVAPGETLWGIAVANRLPASAVATANGLSPDARVVAGTTLTIPLAAGQTSAPVAAAGAAGAAGGYRVRPGDTLSGVAARQGVSIAALAAANGLKPDSQVLSGTFLRLPGAGSAPATAPTQGAAPAPMGAYKVRPGDTLSGLAAAAGVPAAQMAYMNGL